MSWYLCFVLHSCRWFHSINTINTKKEKEKTVWISPQTTVDLSTRCRLGWDKASKVTGVNSLISKCQSNQRIHHEFQCWPTSIRDWRVSHSRQHMGMKLWNCFTLSLNNRFRLTLFFLFSFLKIYKCEAYERQFFQVGDGDTDHYCWQRPEDMTTSRRAYKVDADNPGSDIAGETAAAMAAASIVFRRTNPHYSQLLLHHAQQVC